MAFDLDLALKQARELLVSIDRPVTARVVEERQHHAFLALGAMARCRALLLSIVTLAENGRGDTAGVQLRALLEMWYFGVIALLGDDDDLERFKADHLYWKNDLARKLGQSEAPGEARPFSVWERAKRSNELLGAIGEKGDTARDMYRQLYSGESFMTVHASFQTIDPYAFEDDDGTVGVVYEPEVDNGAVAVRLGAILTATLARWMFERVGIDTAELTDIEWLG